MSKRKLSDPFPVFRSKQRTTLEEELFEALKENIYTDVLRAIKRGANLNSRNIINDTPLLFAIALSCDEMIIRELLKAGGNVNAQDADGNTSLALAIRTFSYHFITPLLECGADPNITNNNGDTALHLYLQHMQDNNVIADPMILPQLTTRSNVHIKNQQEVLPLQILLHASHTPLSLKNIYILIEHGASTSNVPSHNIFSMKDPSHYENNLLYAALLTANTELLEQLLLNEKDESALLLFSVRHRHIPTEHAVTLINFFVKRQRSNINTQSTEGFTPLHYATFYRDDPERSYKLSKALIEAGADPNICDFSIGAQPIFYTNSGTHVEKLLEEQLSLKNTPCPPPPPF